MRPQTTETVLAHRDPWLLSALLDAIEQEFPHCNLETTAEQDGTRRLLCHGVERTGTSLEALRAYSNGFLAGTKTQGYREDEAP